MLLRHGRVIAEATWSPYRAELPHSTFSISKSFTSMAIGLLIDEGRLSLDDLLVDLLPDDLPAEMSPHLAAVRLRHVLEMTSGTTSSLGRATNSSRISDVGAARAGRTHPARTRHALDLRHPATYLLSCIVQRITGGRMLDYLTPRLFEPLGIENPTWEQSARRAWTPAAGASRSRSRISRSSGSSCCSAGNGTAPSSCQQRGSTTRPRRTPTTATRQPSPTTSQLGYGYQFWRCRHGAYRGDGAFGQLVVVMPEQDAVFVGTAATPTCSPCSTTCGRCCPSFDQEGPTGRRRLRPAARGSSG